MGRPYFSFGHSRLLGCSKLARRCNFRGTVVMAVGKLYKGDACRDSFLKDLSRKSDEIRATEKHFDTYVHPFLYCSPFCLCFFTPPLPCLLSSASFSPTTSLAVSPSFPWVLSSYCHCHLARCGCAALLPCVVTNDRWFTSRWVTRIWVCFILPLDFNQGSAVCMEGREVKFEPFKDIL